MLRRAVAMSAPIAVPGLRGAVLALALAVALPSLPSLRSCGSGRVRGAAVRGAGARPAGFGRRGGSGGRGGPCRHAGLGHAVEDGGAGPPVGSGLRQRGGEAGSHAVLRPGGPLHGPPSRHRRRHVLGCGRERLQRGRGPGPSGCEARGCRGRDRCRPRLADGGARPVRRRWPRTLERRLDAFTRLHPADAKRTRAARCHLRRERPPTCARSFRGWPGTPRSGRAGSTARIPGWR